MMLVGASGGDYALIFAYLANLIINWDSMISCKSVQDPNKSFCGKIPWKVLRLIFLRKFKKKLKFYLQEKDVYKILSQTS